MGAGRLRRDAIRFCASGFDAGGSPATLPGINRRMWTLARKSFAWGVPSALVLTLLAYLALPWPVRLRWSDPETTSFMRYRVREAKARGETLELRRDWLPRDEISPNLVRAIVLAEDGRFEEHGGVDWLALAEEVRYDGEEPFSWFDRADVEALARSARYYLEHRDEVRGRSTITQQLAKNLYYTPDRSLSRKVAEFFVAQRLEWFLTKDRILELYLNTVELGPGIFGVEAAAQEYFGTSARDLSRYQAASLAGTLPHPLTSNPAHRPSRMAWRRDRILDRMSGGGGDLSPIPEAPEIPEIPASVMESLPEPEFSVPSGELPQPGDIAVPAQGLGEPEPDPDSVPEESVAAPAPAPTGDAP